MNRQTSRTGTRILAGAGIAAVMLLAGCEQMAQNGANQATGASAPGGQRVLRVEERDVERPDIYETRARGLWDGRFSLGGRWVAVPQNVDAERVRITNLDNNRAIDGALFRREVDMPGPPIMVSMDAATALGMQAGAPANMRIVVLRRDTVEVPAPAEAEPAAADAETAEAAAPVAGGTVETAALPAAPTAASGASPQAAPAAAAAPVPAAPAAAPATAAAGDATVPSRARIQVAGGANREGAEAVVRRLRQADIPAEIRTGGTEAQPFFRVVAGPFQTTAALNAALAQLRELGYADAFPVN